VCDDFLAAGSLVKQFRASFQSVSGDRQLEVDGAFIAQIAKMPRLECSFVMIPRLDDDESLVFNFVNEPVLVGDAAGPITGVGMFEHFGFANPGVRIPRNLFDQIVDLP
jgi:hypothetical protein